MENFLSQPGSWLGLLGSAALFMAGKYLIPFLKTGKRQKYAGYITQIADEVTDDLRSRYPDQLWLQHLDEAIDKLAAICQVDPEIARRAVGAAVTRKTAN